MERRTEAVDREKREREAQGIAVRRKSRLKRNLWSELDAQRKLDTGNKHVQKEGQAAHFPCKGMSNRCRGEKTALLRLQQSGNVL